MLGENGAKSEDEVGEEEGPGHAGLVGHGQAWGSPVPGILQARILEWVAISFSNA